MLEGEGGRGRGEVKGRGREPGGGDGKGGQGEGGVKRKPRDTVGAAEAVEEVGDAGLESIVVAIGRSACHVTKVVAGLHNKLGAHGGLQL